MTTTPYHVIGLGAHADDLHCIGWTGCEPAAEPEGIVAQLLACGSRTVAAWAAAAREAGSLSIVDIEPVDSLEAARSTACSLARYFRSLGLDVITDADE